MIEPTSKDVKKRVEYRREDGSTVVGVIEDFSAQTVTIRIGDDALQVARGRLNWPSDKDKDPKAASARHFFEGAGFTIEEVDATLWRVKAPSQAGQDKSFLFWPSTGYWKYPDGRQGSYGARSLINAARD